VLPPAASNSLRLPEQYRGAFLLEFNQDWLGIKLGFLQVLVSQIPVLLQEAIYDPLQRLGAIRRQ
jgi:hypothetical protein